MDFAGGYACGVTQAGFDYVAKREPSFFGGFGVSAVESNFNGVQVEVSEPEFWSVVKADMVFGCPPCSGFSMLSTINTADSKTGKMVDGVRVAQRGVDSPDNKWMSDLMRYAAKVKPGVVVMESVASAGKIGAPLMEQLWQLLREESGLDYHLTSVFMNAALVGGDVIRPRYFFVAHLAPFGVDLPSARPRSLMELIGDLPLEAGMRTQGEYDSSWGHVTNGSRADERTRLTIEEFRKYGYDWAEGKRLPEHLEVWTKEMGHEYPEWWYGSSGELLSHAVSDNMYSPFRWRAGKPMGVVTGGFMDRAIHPIAARPFTYREGARFMGFPDDWSLKPIVEGKRDAWLGKAIPVAAGRWISTWARGALEEEPGEYAGVLVAPKHRIIDVSTSDKILDITRGETDDWWERPETPRITYSYANDLEPSASRRLRTDTVISAAKRPTNVSTGRPSKARTLARGQVKTVSQQRTVGPIVRIRPEEFQQLLDELRLSRVDAARALGVSPSRIGELTGHTRPKSWLNADRWPDVQVALRKYGAELASAIKRHKQPVSA